MENDRASDTFVDTKKVMIHPPTLRSITFFLLFKTSHNFQEDLAIIFMKKSTMPFWI